MQHQVHYYSGKHWANVNNIYLFLVRLAVAAADPVSCAPQTEAKASGNAGYIEQSGYLECEAVPAMPPLKYLCTVRNEIQTK